MGTLGGIGELAREVMSEGKPASASKPQAEKKAGRGAPPSLPGVPRVEG
jgi:hypothetical protein